MKNPTLTEIRKAVEASGGNYSALAVRLNGYPAYMINGRILSRSSMIESYKRGELL